MSRGTIRIWRPLAVWTAATAAALGAAGAAPGAWRAARSGASYDRVEDLLVAACTTGLALALAWLWVITTATVVGLLTGWPSPRGGATRRLVLLACGAAVVAGTSAPAMATAGDGRELLVGLSLPERAVAPASVHRTPQPHARPPAAARAVSAQTYVVRPGDSLWSIARDHPGAADSVDQRWHAIWLANRAVVGGDPDLILPGQVLHLPATRTTPDPTSPDPTSPDPTSPDPTTQAPNSDGDR